MPMLRRRTFLSGIVAGGLLTARVVRGEVIDFIGRGDRLPTVDQIRAGSADYWELADLINEYRKQHGLSRIPLSPKLTAVAMLHARDLREHAPHDKYGSLHSWSKSDKWRGGPFDRDDASTHAVMWDKPKDLFGYGGYGFEVAVKDARDTAHALATLQASKLHDNVLRNRGDWADKRWSWQALGAVFYQGFACAWFGDKPDA